MNKKNGITWCTATANYRSGCKRITAGCGGKIKLFGRSWAYACWAEEQNNGRLMNMPTHARRGHPFGDKLLHPERLPELRCGRKSPNACEVVFVGSITDLFNADFPERYTELEFHFFEKYKQHIYIILTKRPDRMATFVKEHYTDNGRPLPDNIILGVSITGGAKNAQKDHEFCEFLRNIPCKTRMISLEPMIGQLDPSVSFKGLQWVVVGGCSGADAPPMDPAWAEDALNRAATDGAIPHFKQNGEWAQQSDVGRATQKYEMISANTGPDGPSVDLYRYGVDVAGRKLNGKYYDGFPSVIASNAVLNKKIQAQLYKHTHAHDPKGKRAQTTAPQATKIGAYTSVTLDEVPDEVVDYLWEPYLTRKMLNLISGPRGSGKTHLALAGL